MTPNTPMINCKLAAGESICAVCGSMVPDYCLKREEPSDYVGEYRANYEELTSEELEAVDPAVDELFRRSSVTKPFKDHYGIVTGPRTEVAETPQEPEATEVSEEVPAPVVEAPKLATKRGRKKRGGN